MARPLPNVTDAHELGLKALAAWLQLKIPQLSGIVDVGEVDWEVERDPPYLTITPTGTPRAVTFLGGDDVVDESGAASGGSIVVCLGEWVGSATLVLGITLPAERAALGSAIVQALLGTDDDDAPGVRTLPLDAQVLLNGRIVPSGKATASFELATDDWVEEQVFARDRRRLLEVDFSIGILVARGVPGTMDQITVRMAAGTSLDTADSAGVTSDLVLSEDGELTR